jgi:acyl-CoA synthetase (AMP-forming)/AMP-acid ligase II
MYYPLNHPLRLLAGVGYGPADQHLTIVNQFEKRAGQHPERTFLVYDDERYSYGQANALINQHSHAYRKLGLAKGDVVALVLENRPEFLWHMFGLHKLGALASLINTHLKGDSLVHALRICRPKHVVVGSELWDQVEHVRGQLDELGPGAFEVDVDPRGTQQPLAASFGDRLRDVGVDNPTQTGEQTLSDLAAFIYTSGTTGLPKAAVINHRRFFRGGAAWAGLGFGFRTGDVLYNCLPLYHANAVLLATSSVISAGVTMALGRKFSRQNFWNDVRRYDASAFIYIGELCRYLMNNEPSPRDREHRVRAISGNGLGPDIWRGFQERFGLKRIVEFYGATEGNCITINALGVTGSVGPMLLGMALARWNEEQGDFVRGADGHLVRVKRGEPGVLLGRIEPRAEYIGYQDKAASETKVVRNAFAPGDAWFNTGDLLRLGAFRHMYFVDRLGDTYRWKGENVATSEVQERLSSWPPLLEANVYGVKVPGLEGRAGMVALVLTNGHGFDASSLRDHVKDRLPGYARPAFVRVMKALNTTSTFKNTKADLQKEGFDPRLIKDPLYVLDLQSDQYVPLTSELYEKVVNGELRL